MGIELIVFIIPRGRSDALVKLCRKEGLGFTVLLHGMGTAPRELLSILGLGDTERDIVLTTALKGRAWESAQRLAAGLELYRPGGGIAFLIPLAAAASQMDSISLLSGNAKQERQNKQTAETNGTGGGSVKRELVITVVKRGFADEVMAAARSVGASGGTVVNARGSGRNELKKFFGSVIEPEKELVLTLVESERRSAVMEAITRNTGLASEGMGICFSLPVTGALGMREE